jgi:hypothetical protein
MLITCFRHPHHLQVSALPSMLQVLSGCL